MRLQSQFHLFTVMAPGRQSRCRILERKGLLAVDRAGKVVMGHRRDPWYQRKHRRLSRQEGDEKVEDDKPNNCRGQSHSSWSY
jgi:hypothetical protein